MINSQLLPSATTRRVHRRALLRAQQVIISQTPSGRSSRDMDGSSHSNRPIRKRFHMSYQQHILGRRSCRRKKLDFY